jgi:predicted ATPase
MITLTSVTIHKYKSFEREQTFSIEKDMTILVGLNESGKTSALEAIAKTNYFEKDSDFEFQMLRDFPRREKKSAERSDVAPDAATLTYQLSQPLLDRIIADVGEGVLVSPIFTRVTDYANTHMVTIQTNFDRFIEHKVQALSLPKGLPYKSLKHVNAAQKLAEIIAVQQDTAVQQALQQLQPYVENKWRWESDPISEYIVRVYITPNLPKFLYYDEYYALPSRISISALKQASLTTEELKTAKALFQLAEINVTELTDADSFEDLKTELESTEAIISDILLKYWKNNANLSIEFEIDKQIAIDPITQKTIVDHVLDIRVRNTKSRVSLPLRNRSKGFNWFFSFLVWFKKIQADKDSTYIILLDEPGLNLHATAQADLLTFFNDLAKDYQMIYTTHSPFMIEADKLVHVRTVLETHQGSKISESIQEKDANTLFPLQASLGYNIAQHLFNAKHNVLVEGVSDLLFLQVMSSVLKEQDRIGLDAKITIMPVGGLDKITTFISLLRSQHANMICLLDSFTETLEEDTTDVIIGQKIISNRKIRFFHEFVKDYAYAQLEDLFSREDYLKFYNEAFPDKKIRGKDLVDNQNSIVNQINDILGTSHYDQYLPANVLVSKGIHADYFSNETLDNFERMFKAINDLV